MKNLYLQLIENRLKVILDLIKQKNLLRIEKEVALLVLDIIDALQTKSLPLKQAGKCFIKIEYALNQEVRTKLSEDFKDLLNEGIILDELGKPNGADPTLMLTLATKILNKDRALSQSKIKTLVRLASVQS